MTLVLQAANFGWLTHTRARALRSAVYWTAILVLSGCGGGADDPPANAELANREQPLLINAPLDPGHKFDVGICKGSLVPEGEPFAGTCADGSFACSGTLIAPNVVLTARHCVSEIDFHADLCDSRFAGALPGQTLVTTSSSVYVGSPKWYQVTSEHFPTDDRFCSGDVALLILAERVPAREARPAGVNLRRDFASRPPKSVAIVGRGIIDWTIDLETFEVILVDVGDFQRRVLENIPFECATNDPAAPCNLVDFSLPPSNILASPPAFLVFGPSGLPGDSGSGVFDQRNFNGSRPQVIGVTSEATIGPDGKANHVLAGRLDTHAGFIRGVLRRHSPETREVEGDALAQLSAIDDITSVQPEPQTGRPPPTSTQAHSAAAPCLRPDVASTSSRVVRAGATPNARKSTLIEIQRTGIEQGQAARFAHARVGCR